MTNVVPTDAEIARTVQVLAYFAQKALAGDPRPYPLPLYLAQKCLTTQPAIECVILHPDPSVHEYALFPRGPNDVTFGPNKLHVHGGVPLPGEHADAVTYATATARAEHGIQQLDYIAGPIAVYQWVRDEHPEGAWPRSELYVFRASNLPSPQARARWVRFGHAPRDSEMINGRSGQIHLMLIRAFDSWRKSGAQSPCIDLNADPL